MSEWRLKDFSEFEISFRPHDSIEASSPVYAFFEGKLVTKPASPGTLTFSELEMELPAEPLYVGHHQGSGHYALELSEAPHGFSLVHLWDFLDAPRPFFEMAGRAMQLISWDRSHRYCGSCGSPTQRSPTEWSRRCPACGQSAYPRISPCVIMAVKKGESILLAQRPASRHQLYTVLAGFVEAGESAEQAVRREVREEVGIELNNIRYFGSQPWPFPGQLMIGFIAEYESGDLNPDLKEVINTGWFHYGDLPDHPGENTISGRLIRQAVAEITVDIN